MQPLNMGWERGAGASLAHPALSACSRQSGRSPHPSPAHAPELLEQASGCLRCQAMGGQLPQLRLAAGQRPDARGGPDPERRMHEGWGGSAGEHTSSWGPESLSEQWTLN